MATLDMSSDAIFGQIAPIVKTSFWDSGLERLRRSKSPGVLARAFRGQRVSVPEQAAVAFVGCQNPP
jgi:hypothetical protein